MTFLSLSRPLRACFFVAGTWVCACGPVLGDEVGDRSLASTTIVLTGHALTVDQVVAVARHGARVDISAEARQRAADSFALMLEAQHEGIAMYRFNRGAGSGREKITLRGDPDSADNRAILARRHDNAAAKIGEGAFLGFGEEIADAAVGRAMLIVNANVASYEAVSAGYLQGMLDLLNHGVTPVVHWRGAIGESDFVPVGAVMTGRGFAYFEGQRLPAAEALRRAGLKPLHMEGNDEALGTTSSLTAGYAALLTCDARDLLDWHDVLWAMDLEGMNGNVGPLSLPVRVSRPFPWASYAAERVLAMLKGSYLFDDEPRIIQDAESLRATVWRSAGTWGAWAHLREATEQQMNGTDHNPTVRPGISPGDSWELSTPQLLKFHVKGGPFNHGQEGYILSNADWDPYPLVNEVEAFPIALTNLMIAVVQRMHRFEDPFFTVLDADKLLRQNSGPHGASGTSGNGGGGAVADALWQELKPLANPIPPDGVAADRGVGDLDAVPMLKLKRLDQALTVSRDILAQDLLNASFWINLRQLEHPQRRFGATTARVQAAFRETVPFQENASSDSETREARATLFLRNQHASAYLPKDRVDGAVAR